MAFIRPAVTSGASFNDAFASDNNPLASPWINGSIASGWRDLKSVSGKAVLTSFIPTGYGDGFAYVPGFNTTSHFSEATAYIDPTYDPIDPHEMEILVCCVTGPGASARVYEALYSYTKTGFNFQFMRWNGTEGDFTESGAISGFSSVAQHGGIVAITDGMLCRTEARVSPTEVELRVFQAGELKLIVTDSSATRITDGGAPGLGFFARGNGNVLTGCGWANYRCGDL